MTYEKENKKFKQYKDIPYTMVGHTSLPTQFHMALKAAGIKKILREAHDEDMLHITVFAENKATEFELSKHIEADAFKSKCKEKKYMRTDGLECPYCGCFNMNYQAKGKKFLCADCGKELLEP